MFVHTHTHMRRNWFAFPPELSYYPMIRRVSKVRWWSLLTKQCFRGYHLPSLRGRNETPRVVGEITYFQQEDEHAKPPESTETPSLPKHPHHSRVTRSQNEGSAGAATETAMEPVSSCSPTTADRGFLHPPHSPTHRASTPAGNFTKLLCFIHVCTFGYVYTYADTGPHISGIFICCNIAYTVNTSVLLQ